MMEAPDDMSKSRLVQRRAGLMKLTAGTLHAMPPTRSCTVA